jgi:hypothetical protein
LDVRLGVHAQNDHLQLLQLELVVAVDVRGVEGFTKLALVMRALLLVVRHELLQSPWAVASFRFSDRDKEQRAWSSPTSSRSAEPSVSSRSAQTARCARGTAFQRLAASRRCTAAELLLRNALNLGLTPLTGTTSAERMAQDLALPGLPLLGAADMALHPSSRL